MEIKEEITTTPPQIQTQIQIQSQTTYSYKPSQLSQPSFQYPLPQPTQISQQFITPSATDVGSSKMPKSQGNEFFHCNWNRIYISFRMGCRGLAKVDAKIAKCSKGFWMEGRICHQKGLGRSFQHFIYCINAIVNCICMIHLLIFHLCIKFALLNTSIIC
jgi:hypothetical protein